MRAGFFLSSNFSRHGLRAIQETAPVKKSRGEVFSPASAGREVASIIT
jgi:hypothetical protein